MNGNLSDAERDFLEVLADRAPRYFWLRPLLAQLPPRPPRSAEEERRLAAERELFRKLAAQRSKAAAA